MRETAGRALTQARPAGVLLAVPLLLAAQVYCLTRGGGALAGFVACAFLLVVSARWLARQHRAVLVRAAGTAACAAAVVAVFALALGPRLLGYQTMTVLSTSMDGTFNPGDVILVTREPISSVRGGQVLSFHIPTGDHHVVTHRVATAQVVHGKTIIQTKGDANAVADPWKAVLHGSYVWRYRGRLPYAGYPLLWLRGRTVHQLGLYGAPALLVLLMLIELWFPGRLQRLNRRVLHHG